MPGLFSCLKGLFKREKQHTCTYILILTSKKLICTYFQLDIEITTTIWQMISSKMEAIMGGYGSGNRFQSGKTTTGNMRALDVRLLHRKGFLAPGQYSRLKWSNNGKGTFAIGVRGEGDRVTLIHDAWEDGEWGPCFFPVTLNWTACHLGGQRPWFMCPRCGQRVAILYAGESFACRRCHDLAYPSQREGEFHRALRRARKIQRRLGWDGPYGWRKPKGMHWLTFERLVEEHGHFDSACVAAIAKRFNLPAAGI